MSSSLSTLPLALLRCPYCSSTFSFEEAKKPAFGRGAFGVLVCGCSVFPVLDDIPIIQRSPVGMFEHTTGRAEIAGIPVDTIVSLVRRGEGGAALCACLTVPRLPRYCQSIIGWRIANSGLGRRLASRFGSRTLWREILNVRDAIGARDVLGYYYASQGPLNVEVGQYFVNRFSQPRYLSALALVSSLFRFDSKPILDIACGTGHLEHYFGLREERTAAVGVDMNFYHLWIARHWIAPLASYVCANVNDGLPFIDDCFSATVCSDAFHYIENKAALLRNIERVAVGRPAVLTRVGNASVMPNEGIEHTVDGYVDEIAGPDLCIFSEDDLVKHYLHRRNPFAIARRERGDLRESKWLSFAWNVLGCEHRVVGADEVRPHAVGALGVNPIYSQKVSGDGSVKLRFEFPSAWYAYENYATLAYHPRSATLSMEQARAIHGGGAPAALGDLIEKFVLLGLPERF